MLVSGSNAGLPRRAATLGGDVVLAMLPPGTDEDGLARAAARTPPYGAVALQGPAGPLRLAAFRRPAARPRPPHALDMRALTALGMDSADDAATPFRMFDERDAPTWPGLATVAEEPDAGDDDADPLALAEQLDAPSRRRLLDFLLSFCRAAFRLGADPDFAATCARAARLCATDEGRTVPVAALMPGWQLLGGVTADAADALYVIGQSRVRLNRADAVGVEGEGLQAVEGARPGDLLLAIGERVRIWTVAAPAARLANVLALHDDASGFAAAARRACIRAFARAAPGSDGAALARELHLLHPAQPRRHDDPALPIGGALELALPDGAGGLFLRGWLRDPLDLVADATLVTPAGEQPVPPASVHRVERPDLAPMLAKAAFRDAHARPGFVAHLADPSGGACPQPMLRLRLRSGAVVEMVPRLRPLPAAAARDVVLSSALPREARGAMLRDCLVPAAAALHRQARAERGAAQVLRFGTPHARPAVSLLIPLYRNLGFLRFQLGAFAADPACRAAEIVFALDSPEQEDDVAHLLRGLHHLHGLPMTLVVMERNAGYSAATNAAAQQARAPLLLLLNSDVVPHRPGWLAALIAARARARCAAAAAKLLFDDGSLQHAGLYFERDSDGIWFNRHYHKGMPRAWPGADTARRVPGGTGAALLVERAKYEAAGGLCEDYVVGDYEDSDLCLRLQAAGGAVWYAPEAELFHFERRSIALHAGYQRTLACQYNRHLHHTRWDAAMAALMAERRFRPGARG